MKVWRTIIILIALLSLAGTGAGIAAKVEKSTSIHLHLSDANIIYEGQANDDWAGYSVSTAGDVNNDGFDDILVGAPMAGTRTDDVPGGEGKAYLILGHQPDLWPTHPIDLSQAEASFKGCAENSKTGRQVAPAGDVNGDGYDDFLIVGAQCVSGKGSMAFLFLGRANPDWNLNFQVDGEPNSFMGETRVDIGSMYVTTAGDVNGDHYDDFLISAALDDEHGTDAGQVYLILGKPEADWGKNYHLSTASASFVGEGDDSRAGRSAAAAGDVNGDGYDDFLIGALGKMYLILGKQAADWGMDFSLANANASFVAETTNDEVNNELGKHISGAGDVNGDGLDDFLAGAPDNDQTGGDAGKTYLFFGRAQANWGKNQMVSIADAAFLGEYSRDLSGAQVSKAGDLDGDGLADFLIGAPHSSLAGTFAGAAYVIYGQESGDWGKNFSLARSDAIYIGEEGIMNAGYSTSPAGDFNGDGTDDFLVGAYGGADSVVPGQAYLITDMREVFDLYLPLLQNKP